MKTLKSVNLLCLVVAIIASSHYSTAYATSTSSDEQQN